MNMKSARSKEFNSATAGTALSSLPAASPDHSGFETGTMKIADTKWLLFLIFLFCAVFLDTAGAQPLTVTTIAGQFGVQDFTGAGAVGVGTQALFDSPGQLHADQAGNLYVCDGYCIKKISPGLSVTILAGHSGTAPGDYGYLDGNGTNALFDYPTDCAIDTNGNVYVVDKYNFVIRKISPAGAVTTFAGNGQSVYIDATGTNAGFTGPIGIAIDSAANLYVSDQDSFGNKIRKISPAGVVSTLAGGPYNYQDGDGVGTNAQFVYPNGLAVDAAGTVYVADEHSIRKITPDGTVTTWVGNKNNPEQDGLLTAAGFYGASEIALDRSGGIYVVDSTGPTIRYVSAAGAVSTVAGAVGQYPSGSNNGVGSGALFDYPAGITVGFGGNVYLTAEGDFTILEGAPPPLGPISSVSESAGVSPIRSNNPWQFTAVFTDIVSDVRLRVQSTTTTNDEGSWTDLPGNVVITDVGGNWTFNATDVPTGTQYFRVVASAPGYFDSASAAVGPETVLAGITPLGLVNVQTTSPYSSGASWTFSIVEPSVIAGLGLRVQSSPDGANWNTLADGQMSTSDSVNWTLTIADVPIGTSSFRVVASAPTYPDEISGTNGPFTIVAGLPAIGFFLHSTGGTPVRSSNPWQFLVYYTNMVSGLKLRVQSSGDQASWADLPGSAGAYMSKNQDGSWTLNKTDVPTGTQYFRVVASATGYVDGVSAVEGPETVLPGFDPWGYFSYATSVPYSTATPWSFVIGQTSQIPGMSLRMQFSGTPNDPTSWSDLPGGSQMYLHSAGIWAILTTNLPTGTNVYFQAVASAPNYVDLASGPLGPFLIRPPLPNVTTSISQGGTRSLESVGLGAGLNNFIHVIGNAIVHFFHNGDTSPQGTHTLSADSGASVDLTITNGQVFNGNMNLGKNSALILTGTVNGDVGVGLIGQDGSGLIGQDGSGLIGQDGSTVISNDGGSLAQVAAQIVSSGAGNIVSSGAGNIVSSGAGNIVSSGAGNIVSSGAGNIVSAQLVTKALSALKQPNNKGPLPADSPFQPSFTGQMIINGDYDQFLGTLVIAIAGTNTLNDGAQQFDQLVVSGTANLMGGTIAFGLFDPDDQTNQANVFQPPDGATFDVVVASNIVLNSIGLLGPIWGDGEFFTGSVVTRTDGLQAVRLTATHIPPRVGLMNTGSSMELFYATNYTGYAVESSPDLVNWNAFSTGTNIVMLNPTNTSQFFRLSKP